MTKDAKIKTAKEFWTENFGPPENDHDRLAITMMAQYRDYITVNLVEHQLQESER